MYITDSKVPNIDRLNNNIIMIILLLLQPAYYDHNNVVLLIQHASKVDANQVYSQQQLLLTTHFHNSVHVYVHECACMNGN